MQCKQVNDVSCSFKALKKNSSKTNLKDNCFDMIEWREERKKLMADT